jgi:nucleotide sugar dehydrogenase
MTYANADFRDADSLDRATVAVYGLGKMGLPLAAVLADHGATVLGVDVDPEVVAAVNDGTTPVEREPGLPEFVAEYGGDRLEATTDGSAAAERADVMIVLVPTVLDENDRPRLGPVADAAADIRDGVAEGDLVVLESTVPPGTTAGRFAETVEPDHLDAGAEFGVAHGPERTSSGRAVRDITEAYPKIVGGLDEDSTESTASLYEVINEPGVIRMGSATAAEAVKVFEGVYRDVNIALANELAKACEEWGLDAESVFAAANSQPYCDIHDPGVGVGGHCIPVYPHFVTGNADETPLLETARSVNDGMPAHTVARLETLLDEHGTSLSDARVLVLGVTYRPGVKETRYAPAIDVIDLLCDADATVYGHDPLLDAPEIERTSATAVEDPLAADRLDGVVLATGHDEYRDLDLDALHDAARTPVLVDGRRFFDLDAVSEFDYARVGDGRSHGRSVPDYV